MVFAELTTGRVSRVMVQPLIEIPSTGMSKVISSDSKSTSSLGPRTTLCFISYSFLTT